MSTPAPDERILIVDDEDQIRTLLARLLGAHGYECVTAESAEAARRTLKEMPVALVLSDVNMPGESGIDFTREVLAQYPDTAVVMVTGMDDRRYADVAIELGAYGYILKPFKPNELIINVVNALRRRTLEIESRARHEELERIVHIRTAALRRSHEETIRRLAAAAESRDRTTGRHIERMSRLAELLARRAGLGREASELIRIATPLHDLGKIAIPDRILLKEGPLGAEEWEVMRTHPQIGHDLLTGSGAEPLDVAARIALTHHEKMDGSGYPHGLTGSRIPIEGRIAAVADVFDALTSDRPYRPAHTIEHAVEIMRAGRGNHFDVQLLDVFIDGLDEVVGICFPETTSYPVRIAQRQ
jgi:putative two-component system response regulator